MSNYQPVIRKSNDGSFYALIVYVESDGEQRVIHGYNSRYFKTKKAALKSTNNHIAKFC